MSASTIRRGGVTVKVDMSGLRKLERSMRRAQVATVREVAKKAKPEAQRLTVRESGDLRRSVKRRARWSRRRGAAVGYIRWTAGYARAYSSALFERTGRYLSDALGPWLRANAPAIVRDSFRQELRRILRR